MKGLFSIPTVFRHMGSLIVVASICLPLNACYLASNGKAMEQRMQRVEDQQEEFGSAFERTRDELTELVSQADTQVSSLRETLQEARKLLGDSSATLGVRVDEVENKLTELRGKIDAIQFANEETQGGLETLKTDLEFRIEQLER